MLECRVHWVALAAGLFGASVAFAQGGTAPGGEADATGSAAAPAEAAPAGEASPAEGTASSAEGSSADGSAAPAATAAAPDAPGAAPQGGAAGAPSGVEGQTTTSAERQEQLDAGTYAVRLRDLEQRINELKEQIFRSKARLSLLAETVLQGVVAGSQAVIVHENKMSSSFRLVKAVYALDGAPIFNKVDEEGGLGEQESFQVYNGSIVPGEHTLTVNLEYRGNGFGIFSYLRGYRFKVRSSYTFTAPEGKAVTVRVIGYEKGGPTAPLEERPAIRYVERVSAVGRGAANDGRSEAN